MNNESDFFWLKSYQSHSEYEKSTNADSLESWKLFDTVDAWRHKRMYDSILPFLISYPSASWLTVGDGRYGTDANYMIRNNIVNVLATSISDELLKRSKEDGFIYDYKVENAEKLSFESNSFDFVFCKESYHHFPRPMIAFYEMLRVAKNAVVIIEPNDVNLHVVKEPKSFIKPKNKTLALKNFIKDLLNIKRYEYNSYNPPAYEILGNYIYSVSEREFEKAALGLNLPLISFKGINDRYEEGVEYEKANENSTHFHKIKMGIREMDELCINYGRPYNILVSVIFKTMPEELLLKKLETAGFRVDKLSRNPYASNS